MRWSERGLSPVKTSLVGFLALILVAYFVFEKQLPFTHHRTLNAVVQNSNLLLPGSPVRIGGIDVGTVTSTGRYRNSDQSIVHMQIDAAGQVIHRDATIQIRPRLFLEGNFYVQLSPGSPGSPPLRDGGTIPASHATDPVQVDQLLGALPAYVRLQLQHALQGFGQALDTTPSAATDRHLNPLVRGLTGAQAINRTFGTSAPSLRDSGMVSEALTGPGGDQLSKLVAGLARASAGLSAADDRLGPLISDFDTTMRATAAEQQPLRHAAALLGPTAAHARTAFAALDGALPSTERFATELATGLPQLPATIGAALPWLAQARPLVSERELGGLMAAIRPASANLAALTHDERSFLPAIDAFDRCMTKVFIPTGNIALKDGSLSTGVPNYREFWYAMTGQAAEGQGADGNGDFLRIDAAGGPYPVESGQTNFDGAIDTAFAQMPAAPLVTRPAFPNSLPPLQRSVPCSTQPLPDVNGPASAGPADGSRPDAARPPVPRDPSRGLG